MSASGNGNGRVAAALDKAVAGERITDADALALVRSADLVRVGKTADALRKQRTDGDVVTFIIDRNVNYTNVCHTDCDFCAFYRRPGDRRRGLPPTQAVSSSRRSKRRSSIGGNRHFSCRAAIIQILRIDYYEDLFTVDQGSLPDPSARTVAAGDSTHLASVTTRSISVPDTLTRLRNAGLDSLPGRRRGDSR